MAEKTSLQSIVSLLILVAFAVAVPGCETAEDPLATVPLPASGWLAIESGADGASAWVLMTPGGAEIPGSGDSLITDPDPGEYWLLWEPVEQWNSPRKNPDSVIFTPGSEESFEASYVRIWGDMGDISIDVNPKKVRAQWNVLGPDGFFAAGKGSRTLRRRAVGEYRIIWGDQPGYSTPPESSGVLTANSTLAFRGDFEVTPTGDIEIDVEPNSVDAPWELGSDSGQTWSGSGDQRLTGVPAGNYTLIWGAVEGHVTPLPAQGTLESGSSLRFQAVYVEEQAAVGTIVVNPDPDDLSAPWTLGSDIGVSVEGSGDSTLTDMPVANYVIVWEAVSGHQTPPSRTAALGEGERLEFAAVYEVTADPLGTVVIDPNPDTISAPWQLESDAGETFTGAGDSTIVNLPMGVYTLTWGDVEGYETPSPNPVVQTLAPGGTAVFALE
jgi:hypothetical protein